MPVLFPFPKPIDLKAWIIVLISSLFILPHQILGQNGTLEGNTFDEFGTLTGVSVSIRGAGLSTISDENGFYSIEIPPGRYTLSASVPLFEKRIIDFKIKPGEVTKLNIDLSPPKPKEISFSIGSRNSPRTSLESAVSVDLITSEDLKNSRYLDLSQVLHFISPSFHSNPQTISDGTDHIDPISLRGLGPDQLLILVNGKRKHTSSLINVNGTVGRGSVGTDINSIPVQAVDRIEILRDGAAAQYGSDAIGGVINIILKKDIDQIEIVTHLGITERGDGHEIRATGVWGLELGKKGYLNIFSDFRNRGAVNRSGNYTGNIYSDNDSLDAIMINENDFFQNTGYKDRRVMSIGNGKATNTSIQYNLGIPTTGNVEVYSFGGFNFRKGLSAGFYRFPMDLNKVVPQIHPNGFSPEIDTDILDFSFSIGVRGTMKNWNYDISNSYGQNQLTFIIGNSNNASLGISSPTTFHCGGFSYGQNHTTFEFSQKFDVLKGLNVAFGGNIRVEKYRIIAGEERSWVDGESIVSNGIDSSYGEAGAQVFPGFTPENQLEKYRTNSSGYVDLEAQITNKLMFGGATRFELYSDFGSNISNKLVARYRLMKTLSIRGGYNSGFRAPSLHQVFFNNIGTQVVDGKLVSVGTFNNESSVAQAFGISSLKPEISNNFSLGMASGVGKNFIFTLDGYYLRIRDRIVLSGRFDEGYEAILEPLKVGAAQFLTNAVNTRTMGLDFVAQFKKDFSFGKLNISLAGNFNNTKVQKINVSEVFQGSEDDLFNREEVSRVENAYPNFKLCNSNVIDYNRFKFVLKNTLFGKVEYIHPSDVEVFNEFTNQLESRDQVFSPKVVSDLSVSYSPNRFFEFSIGCNNILNVYPDQHTHSSNVSLGRFVYSRRVQQFGVRGRTYNGSIIIKL